MTLEYGKLAKVFDAGIVFPVLIWIDSKSMVLGEETGVYIPRNVMEIKNRYDNLKRSLCNLSNDERIRDDGVDAVRYLYMSIDIPKF